MGDQTITTEAAARWAAYLRDRMDEQDHTQSTLARAAGLSGSVVSRWVRGGNVPDLRNARLIADALHRPLLEVLVASGIVTEHEAKQRPPTPVDLSQLTADQLLAEVRRRIADGHAPSADDMAADPERYSRTAKRSARKRG